MRKIAVIIYGPPGSGKGTQANLLEKKLDLIHFDTGRFLEGLVHDPALQKNKVIQRERQLFDSGKLLTPSWVLRMTERESAQIARAGWGIVFSGSPRTMPEAKGLLPVLEKLYGKKNIFVFSLNIPEHASVVRNSKRMLCTVCGSTLLSAYYPSARPKHCPVCGGPLYRRTLDNPKTIKVRLKEYHERTEPIFKFLRSKKYRVVKISGDSVPYKVFDRIYAHLKDLRRN